MKNKSNTLYERESILDAAQQAFIRDGYENAGMDHIADLAGTSKRTVYNHFSSKETLFRAVLRRLMDAAIALKQVTDDAEIPLSAQLARFVDADWPLQPTPTGWY